MRKVAWGIAVAAIAIGVVLMVVGVDTQGDQKPQLTKGKFTVPVNSKVVESEWSARGYSGFRQASYIQGWSRGEHTHAWNILITLAHGRMEFIIEGQRFVVEPGDELLYPAHAVISARNLYEGMSIMLNTTHY